MGYRDDEAALMRLRVELEERAAKLLDAVQLLLQVTADRNARLRLEGRAVLVVAPLSFSMPSAPPEGSSRAVVSRHCDALERGIATLASARETMHEALAALPRPLPLTTRVRSYAREELQLLGRHPVKCAVAFSLVGLVAFLCWRWSPTLRGQRTLARWKSGATPYVCAENDGFYVEEVIDGLRVDARRGVALQMHHCKMTLKNAYIRGPIAVNLAGGYTHVTIEGGEIEGCVAIRASHARIELNGVKVSGRFELDDAVVTGAAPDHVAGRTFNGEACATTHPAPADPNMDKRACEGVAECYRRNGALGSVHGDLRVDVGPHGQMRSPTFTGAAPPAVRACLEALALGRHADEEYEGGGQIRCDYAGTVGPNGTEQVDYRHSFTP